MTSDEKEKLCQQCQKLREIGFLLKERYARLEPHMTYVDKLRSNLIWAKHYRTLAKFIKIIERRL
jgi:hypothetical protein